MYTVVIESNTVGDGCDILVTSDVNEIIKRIISWHDFFILDDEVQRVENFFDFTIMIDGIPSGYSMPDFIIDETEIAGINEKQVQIKDIEDQIEKALNKAEEDFIAKSNEDAKKEIEGRKTSDDYKEYLRLKAIFEPEGDR